MKRLLIAISGTFATAILILGPGVKAQSVEMKPCTTQYRSYYAIAGGPHIPGTLSTPINWLLFGALLENECQPVQQPGRINP